VYFGLQILIFNEAGLQILLNTLPLNPTHAQPSLLNYPVQSALNNPAQPSLLNYPAQSALNNPAQLIPAQLTPAQRVNGCGQCREFQIRPPQFQTVRDKFRTKQSGTKKRRKDLRVDGAFLRFVV
jgi:hypothetical protein